MLKKIFCLFLTASLLLLLTSCNDSDTSAQEEKKECWAGQYVMVNEETEEFKILTISAETETQEDVVLTFKSVRDNDEFTGLLKTKSKKYAVCNAGDRCLKFNLKSSATVITVDDIWTNQQTQRNENWTGKYILLQEGMEPESFGDSSWNGRYTCSDNGITLDVYAIKEGVVLITYIQPETEDKLNFKCYVTEANKREALYEDESRSINIKLMRSNRTVVITDTPSDPQMPAISGRYTI